MRPGDCATCRDSGRRGYCARGRCYCGHEACPGFASWFDVRAVPFHDPAPKKAKKPARSTWDDREDSTWIDQL